MATATPEAVKFPKAGHPYEPLPNGSSAGRVQAHAVQTINATPEQVYNIYSRIELLPTWQDGVVSVERTGENTLHWVMQDLGTGKQFEFDAQEGEKTPGKRYTWSVTTGPTAGTTGTLTLEPHPAGRGTITTLITDYTVPGGGLTNALSTLITRSPRQIIIEDLRNLKELIEAGEIPNVEGQPAGPRGISGKFKKYLYGENLPTPPGTSDRPHPEDMPNPNPLGFGNPQQALTKIAYVTIPLIFGAVLWASLRSRD